MKTTYYKGRDGYQAEAMTETDANGQAWQITTMKRSNGIITCSAIQGDVNPDGLFSWSLTEAKRLHLAQERTRCTLEAVQRIHAKGLEEFKKQVGTEPSAPAYVVGVGQVIFTEYHGRERERVIYEVESPGNFKTVTTDGQELCRDSHVRKHGERQGIGTYYIEGETLPIVNVKDLVRKATAATEKRKQKAEHERARAAEERARKIEAGAKILPAIPEGVKAVIVAELHQDESDSQSDYFNHSTKEVVYLAWSGHSRDLFPEMRAAADKFEKTAHLGTGKGSFKTYEVNPDNYRSESGPVFTTEAEAAAYIEEKNSQERPTGYKWIIEEREIEHREKYSMGSGYYLKDGHSNASGWAVSKSSLPDLETLQIAAAEGKLFCNETAEATAAAEVPAGTVQIIEHPKRAGKILVIGETYPIRATLKSLGGWWNKWEKGWEFKAADLDKIAGALRAPDPEQVEEEPAPAPEELPTPTVEPSQAAAANKLQEMAKEQRAKMEVIRAEIAEEVQKIKEIGTIPEGYTRSEHPETPSGYLTREEVKQYNTPASIEARRIESDKRKAGKTNTALPAPQMFINF